MPFNGPPEDLQAIRNLLDHYSDAVTQRDAEAWGESWAQDSRWEMPQYTEFPAQSGRDSIVALWVEAMKNFPGIMFHAWPGSIEVDGDKARMRSYTTEVYDQGDNTVRDRGEYADECVKIDGKWLFSKRVFRNIHKQVAPKGC